jgi:purine-binding chemotaxis protein CheW
MMVDSVCETFLMDASALQPPPDLGSDGGPRFVTAIAALEGRLLAVLDLDAILPAGTATQSVAA